MTGEGPDEVAAAGSCGHCERKEQYRKDTVFTKGQDESAEGGNAQH